MFGLVGLPERNLDMTRGTGEREPRGLWTRGHSLRGTWGLVELAILESRKKSETQILEMRNSRAVRGRATVAPKKVPRWVAGAGGWPGAGLDGD